MIHLLHSLPHIASIAGSMQRSIVLTDVPRALPKDWPAYHYQRPFLQPLPVWNYWPWLLLPLCIGVAIVYKSIKCRRMKQVPREAAVLTMWILAGMIGAAAALLILVRVIERV